MSQSSTSSFRGRFSALGSIFRQSDTAEQRLSQVEQRLRLAEQERVEALEQRDLAITTSTQAQDEAKREVIAVRDELEWKETRLAEKEEQYSRVLGKYDDLEVDYNRISNLLQYANEELSRANEEAEQKTTKLDAIQDRLENKEAEVRRLAQTVSERDQRIDDLSVRLATAQSTASHQQQPSAADQLSLLGFIHKASSEQIEQLKKQLSDKEKELEASQQEVARLERALQEKASMSQHVIL